MLPQYAEPADWQALKLDAFEAEAKGNWQEARHLWRRVLAGNPGDSQAFEAIERIAVRSSSGLSETQPPTVSTTGGRSSEPEQLAETLPIESPFQSPAAIESEGGATRLSPKPVVTFELVTVNERGEIQERRNGQAEYRTEDLGHGVVLELVKIPEGTFLMGSPADEVGRDWYGGWDKSLKNVDVEGPQHRVTVRSVFMGKCPVTQAQWRIVAALPKVDRDLKPDPSRFKGDNRPVEQVSWHDAIEFCKRLSKKTGREYRLPSEAEWEYACRAGTTTPFYFGETITTDLVNYRGTDLEYKGKTYAGAYGQGPHGSYREQTTEVDSFLPNAFGLYDMHGNVWEWCLDHWHKNYEGAPSDGSAWTTGGESQSRLLRGGSWNNSSGSCRSAVRSRDDPDLRHSSCGFRVVYSSAWTL
ncbi:MAG: hypothetical protein Kow00121_30490 [Elainellaceae cyanobacterium]